MNIPAAQAYHERYKPAALVIAHAGTTHESFADGFSAGSPHALYSGTKSFWGTAAVFARGEGLVDLDEPVWNGATIRHLLTLTAGVPFGGLGAAVPLYEKALATVPNDGPGRRFTYGGIPLQIFGAIFSERLRALNMTPHDYLRERILTAAGVTVASWRVLKDGTHPLPTGSFLTAANWLAYGRFMLKNRERFAECFSGTGANPRYGLGWWLAFKNTPPDLFYASGSGGQALYVLPSLDTVVVRFGAGGSFNHEAFLRKCLS